MRASSASAHPEVRDFLLELQRQMARTRSVVMDGRDIGTVVLPNADLKIFLTASAEARAKRRWAELLAKGTETTFEEVLRDTEQRDYQDANRDVAPLRPAEDAVTVDTTELDLEESVAAVCRLVEDRLEL